MPACDTLGTGTRGWFGLVYAQIPRSPGAKGNAHRSLGGVLPPLPALPSGCRSGIDNPESTSERHEAPLGKAVGPDPQRAVLQPLNNSASPSRSPGRGPCRKRTPYSAPAAHRSRATGSHSRQRLDREGGCYGAASPWLYLTTHWHRKAMAKNIRADSPWLRCASCAAPDQQKHFPRARG